MPFLSATLWNRIAVGPSFFTLFVLLATHALGNFNGFRWCNVGGISLNSLVKRNDEEGEICGKEKWERGVLE